MAVVLKATSGYHNSMRRLNSMPPVKWWIEKVASGLEYFIAFLFLRGAWNVWDQAAVDTPFYATDLLASRAAIITYAVSWVALAVGLVYAKLRHKRRLHGWSLMGMYLNGLYIVLLAWFVNGWDNGLIFSVSVVAIIGVLYLRWRYKVIYRKLPKE